MNQQKVIYGLNTLGYLALVMQWLWLCIQFLPAFLSSDIYVSYTSPATPTEPLPVPDNLMPGAILIAVVAATLSIAAGIYAMIIGPQKLTKKAEATTSKAAGSVLPMVTAKKKLAKKRQIEISKAVQLAIKLGVAISGFLGLFFINILDSPPLETDIVLTIGSLLLPWPLLWFGLAHMIDRRAANKKRAP